MNAMRNNFGTKFLIADRIDVWQRKIEKRVELSFTGDLFILVFLLNYS